MLRMNREMDPNVQLQDVYTFEKSLREDFQMVRSVKVKYQALLFILLASNGIAVSHLIWHCYYHENEVTIWILLPFAGGAMSLFLFFFSGTYQRKIANGSRYVLRCNKTLQKFNIYFEPRSGKLVLLDQRRTVENDHTSSRDTNGRAISNKKIA